jgi:subtilisin family serine protease
VAGIIAAKKDGVGVSGVSPGVEILPLRVLNARGEGWLSDIAAAIDYAVLNQAKVINLSLGGSIDSAIIRVAIERAVAQGVIVVGAAGNGGTGVPASFPAAYPGVIAVGATTRDNLIATYSHQGNYIDVAAPGSDILSSWPFGSGYARLSGTSMAAPHVAGLAALLLAQNVAPGSVRSQIESNLVSPQYADYSEDRYGKGVINPYAALGCSSNLLTCTPQANDNAIENTSVAPPVIVPVPTVAPAPAAPAPAPVVVPAPAPVVVVPSIRETLSTKALKKRRIVVNVTAPSGSTTLIQRKVGKKWKTEIKRSSRASQTFKVKRLGTYRVVIVAPNERVTSKSLKARS